MKGPQCRHMDGRDLEALLWRRLLNTTEGTVPKDLAEEQPESCVKDQDSIWGDGNQQCHLHT